MQGQRKAEKMTTREILTNARALIAKGWTQGHYARMASGYPCHENSQRAVSWCLVGAVCRAGEIYLRQALDAVEYLREIIGDPDLPLIGNWNDAPGRTQEEVLALLDRAIAACEAP
jgi:hypothetical protein